MNYYLLNPYIRRVLFVVAADALCFATAAFAAWRLAPPPFSEPTYAALSAAGMLACFLALYYCDAYSTDVLGSGRKTITALVTAMGMAFVAALLLYFAVQTPPGAVATLAHVAGVYFCCLTISRVLFRVASSLSRFNQRVLVIGASDLGLSIARAIRERRNLGLELAGFLSDEFDVHHRFASVQGFPVLGKVHELEKVVSKHRIHRVVVASKSRDEYFPAEELLGMKMRGYLVESGIAFFERVTGRIYLRDLRPSYLIFSNGFRLGRLSVATKRLLDIVVSGLALLVSAPVLLAAAVAIRLDSPGPVLYRQRRVGRGGRVFDVMKLRSMRQDAEATSGAVFTGERDPRITRVGHLLRKTRIDELPQLWNVLRGEMSMVGPRPERPEFLDALCERYPYFRLRLAIQPGLTGWAQVRHGYVNEIDGFEEKLALDLYYMKYRSVKMDLLILWQTIKTLVLFRGM